MVRAKRAWIASVLAAAIATGLASGAGQPRLDQYPSWSPDGRWIAFWRGPSNCPENLVARPDGHQLHRIYGGAIRWDPTMKRSLVISCGADLYLARPDGLGRRLLSHANSHTTWSPDGKQFAFTVGGSDELRIAIASPLHVEKARPPIELCAQCAVELGPIAWSPDGRSIAIQLTEPFVPPAKNVTRSLWLLDLATRQWRRLSDSVLCGSPISWSPDSRLLAFSSVVDCGDTEQLFTVGRAGGPPRAITPPLSGDLLFAWAPRGLRLAVLEYRRTSDAGGLVVRDSQGTPVVRFRDVNEFDWSPDGRRLVFQRENGLYIADARPGGQTARIAEGQSPAWSPLGDAIAYTIDGCTADSGLHVLILAPRRDRQLTRPCHDQR